MKVTVDAGQVNELVADLGNIPERVRGRASTAVRKTALNTEAEAKAFCPVGPTGYLRDSIGTDMDPDGLGASVGPGAFYGVYVEWGTSRMAPRAFMGPAFDRQVPALISALEQAAEEALR